MSFLRHHAAGPGSGSRQLIYFIAVGVCLTQAVDLFAQTSRTGRQIYESACAACHGADGSGAPSSRSPAIRSSHQTSATAASATREPEADWVGVSHRGGTSNRAFSPPDAGVRRCAVDRQEIELAVVTLSNLLRRRARGREAN